MFVTKEFNEKFKHTTLLGDKAIYRLARHIRLSCSIEVAVGFHILC